jgi:hypothetical protein
MTDNLETWLHKQEKLASTSRRTGMADHTPSYQLAVALRIIRALTETPPGKWGQVERWRFDTNVDVAERVLRESQP